ncbi:phosphatidate cytidylyltransferase [Gemella sp. GH3]|uniref:phosphatidate cytidylyltransferase n=1 Tax=unclassified Gemella TaxID=2624949 RepID=UPI0015CFFCC6|nr:MULTISPECIES: phosphatidate cytidylyltransferase [unclassified Gemella]MBF0713931.1 phosphatidate cytidylyltransferase [Gemella sp. GH3.1]NYS50883.1 phosphatidate cytidylyltransferase [Gemella sp. GH3]
MKIRIITAIIALIIFLPFIILGKEYFLFATVVLSLLANYEVVKIVFGKLNLIILILLDLISMLVFFKDSIIDKYFIIIIFMALIVMLLLSIVVSEHKIKVGDISVIVFMSVYIAIGFYSLYMLRIQGLDVILYLLITIWVTDSGAYFGGMNFGKRKLSPNISPNKSIEGSLIGALSSLVVAVGFFFTTDIFKDIILAIVVTLVVSILGQTGDLIESAFKREYNVKDSSNILPGHGGIFDRFDSVILTTPMLLSILLLIN